MDVYKSLKSYDEKCKVLFITGTDYFKSSREHITKDYHVLKKPFNAIDLSNKIYEVLNEQS
jgi:DNA-binding NtrC family response regulator